MQTQFAVVLVHTVTNLVVNCPFPKGFNWAVTLYAFSLLALFANFYRKAYSEKSPRTVFTEKLEANGVLIEGHANGCIKKDHIE